MDPQLEINAVQFLLQNKSLSFEQKLLIKQKGRPTPDLQINFASTSKTRTYNRVFNKNIYGKYDWMCGCSIANKLFCFVCLLFHKEITAWTKHGVNDLKHIAERAKKHEISVAHLNASMDFSVLGKIDIREQLDSAYLRDKLKHNEQVEKNRHILRRLIMCVRFCGAFELALRGHDEKTSSENPGIYVGLVNLAAELDSVLSIHMKESTVFKGTSKSIQNDLLDAMLEVYKVELVKDIKTANFIALEADETTDTSNQQQMVVIIRYVNNGVVCERFWTFIQPTGYTAEALSNALLNELQLMLNLPSDKFKLIAQSYDGASVMSGKNNGVQAIIKKTFPHAHFIHCYAHQFNLIMERAAQCHNKIKLFFANVQSFATFFSRSTKRTAVLDEIVKKRLPRAAPTRWNFKSRTVNTLFNHLDSFKECLEKISDDDGVDSTTLCEANGLLNYVNSQEFLYWLKMFNRIMPHVEIFFNQAQTRGIDSGKMQNVVEQFEQQIRRIRSFTDHIETEDEDEPVRKRQKTTHAGETRSVIAKEVCDTILMQIKERFDFKDHLSAARLFYSKNFKIYRVSFPQEDFDSTVTSYPMLDSVKLKSELTAIYERDDMCNIEGVWSLLGFLTENNLTKIFTESYKLTDIICTTPMSTSECERCFSTLKRIKTFLRNTMSQDRLNALAVLSIEKHYIQCIPDFDNKVIEVFCSKKNRRMDFLFK